MLEKLEDANLLHDIAHMPARVKCAELAWRTLEEMLEAQQQGDGTSAAPLSTSAKAAPEGSK